MESSPWVKHFTDMASGLVPYKKKYYTIQNQTGNGDVQLVTPTQAEVERAKMDVKRKLQEASSYKPKRLRSGPQSGSGQKKKKKKQKGSSSKKSAKSKSSKANKSNSNKSSNKKSSKKKKKNGY